MGKIKIILLSLSLLFIGAIAGNASPLTPASPIGEFAEDDSKEVLRAKVVATYNAQIGVRETLGKNDSPEIREYLKITNINFPAPWCAALVAYCFTINGVDNPKSAWCPSWFLKEKVINLKTTIPIQADVFGIYHHDTKRIAHMGFVDSWPRNTDYFITVEGNTNDNGSREGDRVLKKRRLKRSAYKIARYI